MVLQAAQIETISNLVGEFTSEAIVNLNTNLESYVHKNVSLFVPVYRFCEYAVSPNHSHPSYSFIYSLKQNGCLLLDGKPVIPDFKESTLICGFSPGIKHQEVNDEGFSNYIAVFINKEYFEKILSKYGREHGIKLRGEFYRPNENLLFLLKLLMLEHSNKLQNSTEIIESLNSTIVNMLARIALGIDEDNPPVSNQNSIDKAITFMYEQIENKVSVADIAESVNLSASHFSKIFRQFTNKTPIEYLSGIRIEKAKRLLKVSEMNLTEIAFACGFTSSSYFSHTFIEHARLTPSEYRAKFSSKENSANHS